MKTKFYKSLTQGLLIMSTGIMCLFSAHGQTIRIADNNPTRPEGANIYATLQEAIDAAQAGDIVYITPSVTSYGYTELGKQITLIGAGFNTGLGDRTSQVGRLQLISSTDGINSVSGSLLKGFTATDIIFSNLGIGTPVFDNIIIEDVHCTGNLSSHWNSTYANRIITNLTVRNCLLNAVAFEFPISASQSGLSNSKFYNNIIDYSLFITDTHAPNAVSNNVFANNIILNLGNLLRLETLGSSNNTLFVNNLFSGAGPLFGPMEGTTFNNNIFYGVTPTSNGSSYSFENNTFSYNLITTSITMPPPASAGGANSGLGNITGVLPGFVNVSSTSWDAAFDYSLNSGSAAKNAGSDGTDIGPTGGTYPINKNISFGPASMPIITELNTSGVIPQDQPLKTSIKAISN